MSWAIGFDSGRERDIGYGVPATCDHPGCGKAIDRGLEYVCGGQPYGGDDGCGLFFCEDHLAHAEHLLGDAVAPICQRCSDGEPPFEPTPDVAEWINHKLTDESWAQWRAENPGVVARMKERVT